MLWCVQIKANKNECLNILMVCLEQIEDNSIAHRVYPMKIIIKH